MAARRRVARTVALCGFTAFFVASFSGGCGVIGRGLVQGASYLFGQVGCTLLVLGLVVASVLSVIPPRAWARFVRWAVRPARRSVTIQAPRPIEVELIRPRSPMERMRLDDVRGALKSLGYKRDEYEPIVAGMDPALPLEKLVRDGINALRKPVGGPQ